MPLPSSGTFNGAQLTTVPYSGDYALGVGQPFTLYGWIFVNEASLDSVPRYIVAKGPVGGNDPSWQVVVSKPFAGVNTLSAVLHFDGEFFATQQDAAGTLPLNTWVFFAIGLAADGTGYVKLACNASASFGGAKHWIKQYGNPPDSALISNLYLGAGVNQVTGLPVDYFTGSIEGLTYTPTAMTEVQLDALCMSFPSNPVFRNALPPPPFLLLFEGDDMTCRKALLKDYSQYTVQTGEKIWAYQLIRNYCADWIEVSIGALLDATAAAGSRVINPNFGVRVYECAIGADGKWITNTSGAVIGQGTPIPFPAWQSPVLIPWMGKNVNVMVEFYTADTIPAGATLELGIAPIKEGE